ncbi:MAG: TlpA family protein disulfide reductase [Gemmatimonadetes bacterium]|nr:TlpA family protein disulfide reductase [Gemmatimonadota bacterium]
MSDSVPSSAEPTPPRTALRTAFMWSERAFFVLLLLFVIDRLGPQLTALTGIGPIEGSTPEYAVRLFDGTQLTSDELRGKVVVLNVWATWCPPCRVEIPALQSLHARTARDGDVVVLGLATDIQGPGVVAPFLAERGVTYPNGMLDRDTRQALGGISHTPTTFVIGPDGVVRHKVLGFFAPPAMRAAVNRLRAD